MKNKGKEIRDDVKKISPKVFYINEKKSISSIFLKKIDSAFGIDISESSIELMEFGTLISHKPCSYSRVQLENGVIEKGKILQPDILKQKIELVLNNAKPNKVSTSKVILSLPESQTFTWGMAIDKNYSGSELKKIIFEEAKKNIPLDFDRVYWDYLTYSLPNKDQQYVSFVAVYKDILEDYIKIFTELGLDVIEFLYVPISLARIFLPNSPRDTFVILDIGAEYSSVNIFEGNNILKLSITFNYASNFISKELIDNLKISLLEAEQMKSSFGLNKAPNSEYLNTMKNSVTTILNQAKEAIDYYEKTSGETVDGIYLTGGASLIKGIDTFSSEYFGKEILSFDSIILTKNNQVFQKDVNIKLYANAAGLGFSGVTKNYNKFSIRNQIKIKNPRTNLLKRLKSGYYSTKRMIFSSSNIIYGFLIILLLGLFSFFIWMYFDIKKNYNFSLMEIITFWK